MPQRHHRALENHSGTYLLDVPMEGTTVADGVLFDQRAAFGRQADLVVEVGGGAGDCIVAAAAADPDRDYLGIEVWRPGIAQTIAKAAHAGVRNLRLLTADALPTVRDFLPTAGVAEVWTFFPDPWPKTKHHKRRLVQPQFAAVVARALADGGSWRLASDWADYAWQIRDVVEAESAFGNPHAGRLADPRDAEFDPRGPHGGFAPRFEGRVMTRFERKGLQAGRIIRDVHVLRNPRGSIQ
ncbi:tRNA (guanosine(46)-N7)-methyltransferase TrmB [Branchiibius cervicis]|uniref:tRNA (guanine-N(7)-)-methyltransferase n=1 Tax=Branchiibius cervicis TaxID=908252 RepID=A0ABW2ATK3_9MICO